MTNVEFEGTIEEIDTQDSGQVKNAYLELADVSADEPGIFITIHSWSEDGIHTEFDNFIKVGAKYRVMMVRLGD